jgi:hypothetical protein
MELTNAERAHILGLEREMRRLAEAQVKIGENRTRLADNIARLQQQPTCCGRYPRALRKAEKNLHSADQHWVNLRNNQNRVQNNYNNFTKNVWARIRPGVEYTPLAWNRVWRRNQSMYTYNKVFRVAHSLPAGVRHKIGRLTRINTNNN